MSNTNNNTEHLKIMLDKLKKLQSENDSIAKNKQFNNSIINDDFEKNKLLSKKLEDIRRKRLEIERSMNEKKQVSNNENLNDNFIQRENFNNNYMQNNSRVVDMEFIAERGYSKTSYLKALSAIDGIKENLVKLSSIPNLEKVLSSNLIISNGLHEVVSAMEKVLPDFFEKVIGEKINNLETTRQIQSSFNNQDNTNNVLEKIEKQIDSLMEKQRNENDSRNVATQHNSRNNSDEIDALELEMNLINNLLFKK